MDRFNALRAFIAVADRQSFTAAAQALRISPTAVSRAIAELESELGVTLLRRSTRSVQLTPEGATYLERCRRALDDLDDATRQLRGETSEPRGRLAITAPVVFGRLHVLPIVEGLMGNYPKLNVHLMLTDRVVSLTEEGIDLSVRIADLSDSALRAVRVAEVRRVLVASPAYLARHVAPTTVAHLHDHSLIAFENFAPNNEWRFGGEGKPALRIEPRLLTNSVETAIQAAVDGLGIARALSYQVTAHVRAGRLTYLLPEFEPPQAPVSLLFQANRRNSPNVRAFIEAAQDYFRRVAVD